MIHSKSELSGHPSSSVHDQVFDVAVIGAGVVGCAIARACSIRGWKTLIIEKQDDILEGASKGNSALLHTGYDEPANCLELDLVKAGYKHYRRVHDRMNLPLNVTTALVVAWNEQQYTRLPDIAAHSLANGVEARLLDKPELMEREPGLASHALGALLVPGEAIIDPWSAPLAYMIQARRHGAELVTGSEVTALTRESGLWRLETGPGRFVARLVVNAAGLFGDRLEAMAGRPGRFTIHPRKGQFVVLDKPASKMVNAIILDVPTERTKGILVSRTIFGNVIVGPTAEDQQDRLHAACDTSTLRDLLAKGAERIPGLANCEVSAAFAGLRPATEHRDYVLDADDGAGWITVGGIRSTGLSSSLGLGEWVARASGKILGKQVSLPKDEDLDWPQMPNISEYAPRPYQSAGHSPIVCHCEWVTQDELDGAINGPVPAGTLGGLKRRTRVMMGRCQGFSCSGAVYRSAPHLFSDTRMPVQPR